MTQTIIIIIQSKLDGNNTYYSKYTLYGLMTSAAGANKDIGPNCI